MAMLIKREKALNLRLDGDLHSALTAEARRALRSLNSEIRQRLRKSLEPAGSGEQSVAATAQ
jgi:predicted HicB family RNase H-like nuclease